MPATDAILAVEVRLMMGRTLSAAALVVLATTGLACTERRAEPAKDTSAAENDKEPFGRMTVDEVEAKIAAAKAGQAKLAIFDNNPQDRFEKGHVPTAKWVKFDSYAASELPADKDTTLVFYCSNEH